MALMSKPVLVFAMAISLLLAGAAGQAIPAAAVEEEVVVEDVSVGAYQYSGAGAAVWARRLGAQRARFYKSLLSKNEPLPPLPPPPDRSRTPPRVFLQSLALLCFFFVSLLLNF